MQNCKKKRAKNINNNSNGRSKSSNTLSSLTRPSEDLTILSIAPHAIIISPLKRPNKNKTTLVS